MTKILAVSGGVDSMVLMHLFRDVPGVVVAHFNHGTRPSAQDDEEFVRKKAAEYGLPFYTGRAELGENVSEEIARISRYEFFEKMVKELGGEIYTAHHADDLLETMVINLIRGTGWRGLVPFGNRAVRRPFIETELLPAENRGNFGLDCWGRKEIYRYAFENGLSFRFDPTNAEDKYLRNRVRLKMGELDKDTREQLLQIYHKMNNLGEEIEAEVAEVVNGGREDGGVWKYPKSWFLNDGEAGQMTSASEETKLEMDELVRLELLREILFREGISATRPQLRDFLRAIREYPAGRKFNLPKDRMAKIGIREFWILD